MLVIDITYDLFVVSERMFQKVKSCTRTRLTGNKSFVFY